MTNIRYFTLADARREDPVRFDAAIKLAVRQAAEQVGNAVIVKALCNPPSSKTAALSDAA